MSVIASLVIGALAVLTLAVVGWFLTASKVPEQSSAHEADGGSPPSPEAQRGDLDGDPGAETMDPRMLGGDQSPPPDP